VFYLLSIILSYLVISLCVLLQRQRSVEASNSSQSQTVTFGRMSSDRQLSLSERKKALIEAARQRYIEKHGLTSSLSWSP